MSNIFTRPDLGPYLRKGTIFSSALLNLADAEDLFDDFNYEVENIFIDAKENESNTLKLAIRWEVLARLNSVDSYDLLNNKDLRKETGFPSILDSPLIIALERMVMNPKRNIFKDAREVMIKNGY